MLTVVAYILTPMLVLGAGFGAYYMYDPDAAQLTAMYLTWNAIHCYVKLTDLFKPTVKKVQEKQINDAVADKKQVTQKPHQSIVYYVEDEKNTYITDSITEKSFEHIQSTNPLIMFLRTRYNCGMIYFKRTQNPLANATEYLTLQERPFIQVEFIESGQDALDIHSKLAPFYVEGNIILDVAFLKWYLHNYYDRPAFGEYTLKIIDKNVHMFTLDNTQHILIQDGGYTVVNEEEEEAEASAAEASAAEASGSDGEICEISSEEETSHEIDYVKGGITAIRDEEHWETLQESGGKMVVDFTATWCGPCHRIKPFFNMLSNDPYFASKATFVSCDVDELQELAMEAGVSAMPTFQVWQAGKKLGEMMGADEQQLKELVTRHL